MRRLISISLIALALSGCVAQENQIRTVSGQVIGSATAREITPGESPLSLDDNQFWRARYSQYVLPTRTATHIQFRSGTLQFEVARDGTAFGTAIDTATRAIDDILVPRLLRAGVYSMDSGAPTRGRTANGPYAIKFARSADSTRRCALFEQYFDTHRVETGTGGIYTGYLVGAVCGGGADAPHVEAEARRLLDALRYDGGALNRAQTRTN